MNEFGIQVTCVRCGRPTRGLPDCMKCMKKDGNKGRRIRALEALCLQVAEDIRRNDCYKWLGALEDAGHGRKTGTWGVVGLWEKE